MDRNSLIKEYEKSRMREEQARIESEKMLNHLSGLVREYPCVYLINQMPQYGNSNRKACEIDARGFRGTADSHNWVGLIDCATCDQYLQMLQ